MFDFDVHVSSSFDLYLTSLSCNDLKNKTDTWPPILIHMGGTTKIQGSIVEIVR